MLVQEKISGPDTLLKLYVAIDDDLKALHSHLQAKQLPSDPYSNSTCGSGEREEGSWGRRESSLPGTRGRSDHGARNTGEINAHYP